MSVVLEPQPAVKDRRTKRCCVFVCSDALNQDMVGLPPEEILELTRYNRRVATVVSDLGKEGALTKVIVPSLANGEVGFALSRMQRHLAEKKVEAECEIAAPAKLVSHQLLTSCLAKVQDGLTDVVFVVDAYQKDSMVDRCRSCYGHQTELKWTVFAVHVVDLDIVSSYSE